MLNSLCLRFSDEEYYLLSTKDIEWSMYGELDDYSLSSKYEDKVQYTQKVGRTAPVYKWYYSSIENESLQIKSYDNRHVYYFKLKG
jgi:hypothetical protein